MSDAEEAFIAWLRGQGMHGIADVVERLAAERDAMRAELSAEREKVERLASSADEANVLVNKLFAERDELREVLREARPFIFDLLGRSTAEMRERIDHLLLNKGGEDE